MDTSGCDLCAPSVLASFHQKIKEAIALVRSMSTEDKLKAVQCWNIVSDKLQDVVNSSADDISALQSQLCERENRILLQNARARQTASHNHQQPLPSSERFRVIRRTDTNTGPDLGHRQNGVAFFGADIIDHYLENHDAAETTSATHLAVPVIGNEYQNIGACELPDTPSAEQVARAGLRSDPLCAYETVEPEGSEPVLRDSEPLSVPPSTCAENRSDHGDGEAEDVTSPTPRVGDIQKDGVAKTTSNGEVSESTDFRRYLSFVKNETGDVVLNFFTRQPESSDPRANDGHVYQCNVCQNEYSSLAAFYSHFAAHCEQLICCNCGQTCHSKALFRSHMVSHNKSLLKCVECRRPFTTFSNLSRHMKTHTGERRFECSVCQKRFAERKDLRTHSRLHSGERPYECTQCPARFVQLGALTAHLRHHNGERPHLCDLCGKTFAQMATLKDHKLRHEGKKRFPCDRCPLAFNVRSDLRRHRHSHLPEKPHKCSQCSKSFPRSQALAEHLNRHFGNRPYRCAVCTKSYPDRSAYSKHMKTHAIAQEVARPPSPASPDTGLDTSAVIHSASD